MATMLAATGGGVRLAAERGWTVRRIKIDDGCYESDGRNAEGRRIEVQRSQKKRGLDALFLLRHDDGNTRGVGVGRLFSDDPAAIA